MGAALTAEVRAYARRKAGIKYSARSAARRLVTKEANMAVATKQKCTHRWLIDTLPTDHQYPARCLDCPATTTFPFIDPGKIEEMWQRDIRRKGVIHGSTA